MTDLKLKDLYENGKKLRLPRFNRQWNGYKCSDGTFAGGIKYLTVEEFVCNGWKHYLSGRTYDRVLAILCQDGHYERRKLKNNRRG